MQNIKVKDQFVQKLEWKQSDGQTDGRTDTTDRIIASFLATAASETPSPCLFGQIVWKCFILLLRYHTFWRFSSET